MRRRAALLGAAWALSARPSGATERLVVLVPEPENLQFLVFWTALGAGLFAAEGLDVVPESPDAPRDAIARVREGRADVAVLPPPMCLELAAVGSPILLVANLLANDPINLVVKRRVAEARGLSTSLPLAERLTRTKGLRVGVAPNPPVRLRALYASVGLDADRDLDIVIVRGPDQNDALASGGVDALYAHTPYLEHALVVQNAVLVVNQSGGEVPALAGRQIHTLVVTQSFARAREATTVSLVRAIARAASLIRADGARTVSALRHVFPAIEERKLATLVDLYRPAVPTTPHVSVEGLRRAAELFPASRAPPRLAGIDLTTVVDNRFASAALAEPRTTAKGWLVAGGALAVLAGGLVALHRRRRRPAGS